jgi:hypothetical protein
MGAVRTSATSVSFYQTTRRNIPEDRHLHTRRREKCNPIKINKVSRPSAIAIRHEGV